MPETLVFTTSLEIFGGDDVLVERSSDWTGAAVFLQVNGATAFLTIGEAEALNDQLVALILDAKSRAS